MRKMIDSIIHQSFTPFSWKKSDHDQLTLKRIEFDMFKYFINFYLLYL